jgi:hypothetical protein
VTDARRCPSCGALVAADAEWCGQCYASLRERTSVVPASPSDGGRLETPGGGVVEVAHGKATWTCPVCSETNELEVAFCRICGTPFARLFAEPEAPPSVDPERAAVWSVVFPGLGHWKLRRRADAVARFVLFAWSFGTLAVILASRFGKGGLGPTLPLVVLFAGASLAVYAVSILDASRLARGADPIVSSRVLLWASAGVVVLSVLLATFVTLPAARR